MAEKSSIQVVVDGKVLTVGAYEDELHMQQVANCTNRIIREVKNSEAYRCLPPHIKPVLIELNIADELVKAQEYITQLEEDLKLRENELSQTRQELSQALVRLDKQQEQIDRAAAQNDANNFSGNGSKKGGRR